MSITKQATIFVCCFLTLGRGEGPAASKESKAEDKARAIAAPSPEMPPLPAGVTPMMTLPIEQRQALLFQGLIEDASKEYVRAFGSAPASCESLVEEQFLFFAPMEGESEALTWDVANQQLQKVVPDYLSSVERESGKWMSAATRESSRARLAQELAQAGPNGVTDKGYFFRSRNSSDRRLYAFRVQVKTLMLYWGFASIHPPTDLDAMLALYGVRKAGSAWRQPGELQSVSAGAWTGTVGWNSAKGTLRVSLDPGLGKPLLSEYRTQGDYKNSMRSMNVPTDELSLESVVGPWAAITLSPSTE